MTNRDRIIIKDCGCRYDAATNIPLHFCDKHDPARLYHDVEEANRIILTLRQQNAAWVTIAKDIARHCRHKAMGRCIGCRGLAVCDVQGLEFETQSKHTGGKHGSQHFDRHHGRKGRDQQSPGPEVFR